MGEEVYLDNENIVEHYRKKTGKIPEFSEDIQTVQERIKDLYNQYNISPNFNWEKDVSKINAPPLWSLREWIFTQVLYSMPKHTPIILHMFGSTRPTSDIDVTVEARSASDFIRAVEDQWILLTDTSTTQWAVEFYGDFLMFYDSDHELVYLNTQRFDQIRDDELLIYVGVSILRNAGTFDFSELREILSRYPSITISNWKKKAKHIYEEYRTLSDKEKHEKYYFYLKSAEILRDNTEIKPKDKIKAIFLALCHANIFRNENYILPSTVIHIVRDIQAASPKPSEPQTQCSTFKVKLASCALGTFTYLCSALEQIGYMHKYENVPSKYKKYYFRYKDAMSRIVENNNNNSIDDSNSFYSRSGSPTGYSRGGRRKTQRHKRKSQSKRRRSKTRK